MKVANTQHPKGWGYELWIHNDEKYCGKLLSFDVGRRCSFHYHIEKHETFFLAKGKLDVLTCNKCDLDQFIPAGHLGSTLLSPHILAFVERGTRLPSPIELTTLTAGDSFEVPPYLVHMMIAREVSELFEFSTQHFEHDSYRIVKGD